MTNSLNKALDLKAKYGGYGNFHVKKDGDEYRAFLTSNDADGCAVVFTSNDDGTCINKEVTTKFDQDELRVLYEENVEVTPEPVVEESKPVERKIFRRKAKKDKVENEE